MTVTLQVNNQCINIENTYLLKTKFKPGYEQVHSLKICPSFCWFSMMNKDVMEFGLDRENTNHS